MSFFFPIAAFLGFEEPFSSISHYFGALLMMTIGVQKFSKIHGSSHRTSWLIFVLSAAALLGLSGTYHLLPFATTARIVLQSLDHAAIWLLIAATFTSIHIASFAGLSRWVVPSIVWPASICGIVFRSIYFSKFPDWLELILFLSIGWLGMITAIQLHRTYGRQPLYSLVFGGICYSLGALIDFAASLSSKSLVQLGHPIFHICVLAGIFAHLQLLLSLLRCHTVRLR